MKSSGPDPVEYIEHENITEFRIIRVTDRIRSRYFIEHRLKATVNEFEFMWGRFQYGFKTLYFARKMKNWFVKHYSSDKVVEVIEDEKQEDDWGKL